MTTLIITHISWSFCVLCLIHRAKKISPLIPSLKGEKKRIIFTDVLSFTFIPTIIINMCCVSHSIISDRQPVHWILVQLLMTLLLLKDVWYTDDLAIVNFTKWKSDPCQFPSQGEYVVLWSSKIQSQASLKKTTKGYGVFRSKMQNLEKCFTTISA